MGESQGTLFPLEFNRSIHVEACGDRLSSDSGALLLREMMERLGYTQRFAKELSDPRVQERVKHPFEELVRTAVLLLAQGWSDQNDVTRLREDPALRLAVSGRRGQRPLRPAVGREPEGLCSQATLSRLMQELGLAKNRSGLGAVLLWSGEPRTRSRRRTATLDLDSLPLEVFGHQPGAEWNGHYRMCCYHPLVVRSDEGVFLGAKLRPGNVHTADGGLDFVLPVLRRARAWAERVWLRIDAGFPEPKLLTTLEEESFLYVARLKSNAALERLAAPHLASPIPSAPGEAGVRTHELLYQAGSWAHARRVVLVIVERPDEQGELFTDHFFLLSNASVAETAAEALLAHYRQRGTAEKDFGDWKQALELALSSTPRPKAHYRGRPVEEPYAEPDSFAANEARLLLSLVAANLLHAGAELLRREGTAQMSRERFRQLLLKSAGRVLTGGRRVRFLIDSTRVALWRAFMSALNRHYPVRGSPMLRTLPDPA